MKKTELEKIYDREVEKKGRTKDPGEFAGWAKYLLRFDARDVQAGLVEWSTQSRFLPLAQEELLPLVESAERKRRVKAAERKDFVAWRCPGCGYACSGWTNSRDQKRCCRCNEPMGEMLREVARVAA